MTTVRCIGVITIALLANGSARAVSLAHVADSIGAHACSVSTPSVAEVWTRALTDIHAGHGPLALDLLDSLRSSGAQLPESFDFDFAALSAYCYLPGMAEGQGSGPESRRGGPELRMLSAAERLAPPSALAWEALTVDSGAPTFLFIGRYAVRRSLRLTARLRGSPGPLRLRMRIDDSLRQEVATPLAHDPDRPPAPVTIGVAVDRSDRARLPRDEYLQRMIAGQFDKVSLGDDLPARRAVSVRCVRTTPGMPDDYRAYVVVDIPGRQSSRRKDRGSSADAAPRATRYVVVMRAREDVKDEAEDLLAFVVWRFASQL